MKKILGKAIFFASIFLLIGVNMLAPQNIKYEASALTDSRQKETNNKYYGFDMDNVRPFRIYLEKAGFDLEDVDDLCFIGENFISLYDDAQGRIRLYPT